MLGRVGETRGKGMRRIVGIRLGRRGGGDTGTHRVPALGVHGRAVGRGHWNQWRRSSLLGSLVELVVPAGHGAFPERPRTGTKRGEESPCGGRRRGGGGEEREALGGVGRNGPGHHRGKVAEGPRLQKKSRRSQKMNPSPPPPSLASPSPRFPDATGGSAVLRGC